MATNRTIVLDLDEEMHRLLVQECEELRAFQVRMEERHGWDRSTPISLESAAWTTLNRALRNAAQLRESAERLGES